MARRPSDRLRYAVHLLCLLPLAALVYGTFTLQLGANPVETLEHETGLWALILLLACLAVTPLRQLSGLGLLGPLRRTLGLWAFAYAVMHLLIYLLLDRALLLSEIVTDLTERPYIMLGAGALLLLTVLAATSPKSVVRRLGGLRWRRIHRAIYLAAPLAVLHFLWLKADKNALQEPLLYAGVLAVLLGWRLAQGIRSRLARSAGPHQDASRPGSH